jgi:hypothetical protein
MNKKDITKIISAFMLGDGCLRIWNNRPNLNAAYSFAQTDDHKDYVDYQKSIIEQVTSVRLNHYEPSLKNGVNRKGFYKLESKSHPLFQALRERWYHDGKKTISLHDLKQFDFEMLAIWYMDDGYILRSENKYHKGNVFLCTDTYTQAEVVLLQKIIYTSTGVAMDIRRRGTKKDGTQIYRLVARNDQATKFLEGVKPFMFPSFEYKLHTENSDLKSDGDIVCSLQECKEVSRND